MNANIIIVGVGGQGILLTSRILGALALKMGMDIKVSEVHGMSQRGGSVITHVRIGEKVFSPLVDRGEADFVLSFERLESLRAEEYLRPDGMLIENTQHIAPMPVIMGKAVYPDRAPAAKRIVSVDALKLARTAGNPKTVNIVLLGVLARYLNVEPSLWEAAILSCVPEKTVKVNLNAFEAGLNDDV